MGPNLTTNQIDHMTILPMDFCFMFDSAFQANRILVDHSRLDIVLTLLAVFHLGRRHITTLL